MHAAGHAFYQAANRVWLTDHVPPGYLSGWSVNAVVDEVVGHGVPYRAYKLHSWCLL